MRRIKQLLFACVTVLITGIAYGQNFDVAIQNCPNFQSKQYTVYPYISAAIQLQNTGRKLAVPLLRECCENPENQNKVIILYRMLFENEGGMRRPLIGVATFLGNSTYTDWPTEPIDIVENIPFLIASWYCIGGLPESAIGYLEYCELQCNFLFYSTYQPLL